MAQTPAEFTNLLNQLQNAGADTSTFVSALQTASQTTAGMNTLLADMQDKLDHIGGSASSISDSFGDLTDTLKRNLAEISKTDSVLTSAKRNYRGIVSIAEKLNNEQKGVYDFNVKDLKKLQEKAKVSLASLKTNIELLDPLEQQSDAGIALLAAKSNQYKLEEELLEKVEARLKLEKKVEKQLGATNALIEGSSKLFSELGFGHLSSELDDLGKKLRTELREELEKSGTSANSFTTKLKYMGKGLTGALSIFAKGLADPLFLVGKIVAAFLDVNKAGVEFQRLTGQNGRLIAGMNSSFASTVDVLATMTELTKEMGMNSAAIFSPEDLGRLAETKNLLGLTEKQVATLGMRTKVAGVGVEEYQKGIVTATNKYNTLNRSALAHGAVIQEVLNTSDSIALSLGGDADRITAAATAAMQLGLNLDKVDRIASSLMNFEDSIGNELEAQLLTGKNINLSKAREYAMNNDLAGLSKELAKNGASAAEFGKMNRYQQESLAKALGMSREELAKSAQLELLRSGASKEAIEAAGSMTLEQLQQLGIQDRMKVSMDKLSQAFAPMLEAIVPVITAISQIASPIAFVINKMSSAIGTMVGPLLAIYGIFKGIQVVQTGMLALTTGIAAANTFITASKTSELGLGLGILANLGFQNAAETYKQTLMRSGNTLQAIGAALQQTTLYSMLAQSGAILKNIGQLTVELGVRMGIMAASLATNAAVTFGVGVAVALAAAAAGYMAVKSMMSDGAIGPGGETIVSGPKGSIQLDKNDSMIVGTDLFGSNKKSDSLGTAAGSVPEISMAAVEAKLQELINVTRHGMVLKVDGKVLATSNNANGRLVAQHSK